MSGRPPWNSTPPEGKVTNAGFGADRAGAVHALDQQRCAAVVHDRDRHIPLVLLGFRLAGGHHLLHVGGGQGGLGTHGVSSQVGELKSPARVIGKSRRVNRSELARAQLTAAEIP
jgi:hypothetical protein